MAIKTYLTPEEVRAMAATADNLRDKLILQFYGDCGCRVSELLALRVKDIDVKNRVVMIPHLKRGGRKKCPSCGFAAGRSQKYCAKCGNDLSNIEAVGLVVRHRIITIGADTAELLREYIAGQPPNSLLIGLTRQMVYHIVRVAAELIGLGGKVILNPETGKEHYVHPHGFRDSLAVSWLTYAGSDGTKQKALQEHLGHASFATTMRYFKLTTAEVQSVSDEVRKARFGVQKGE
jgi:integrase/recombinase XerD